jgi:uncharacterized protein
MTRATERYGEVTVERDVPVSMPDGVHLRIDLWRPIGTGPLPVLLSRQPYDKRQAQALTFAHPAWYARRGYAVVVQDVRGRWASGGDWEPYLHEADDGAATCAWLVDQSWCNGRIGMWGFSYAGATQLLAATRQPTGLQAIVPVHTASDFYDGWTYNGGALALSFILPWAAFLAADTARRRGDAGLETALLRASQQPDQLCQTLPLATVEPLHFSGIAPWLFAWLANEGGGDYWQRRSMDDRWADIAVPALHVGGWYDAFIDCGIRTYQGLSAQPNPPEQQLQVGPWAHIPWGPRLGGRDYGVDATDRIDRLQLAFFDRHLRDADHHPASAVTVYVLGRGREERFPTWPPPDSQPRQLWLTSEGRANTADGDGHLLPGPPAGPQPPDLYVYDPAFPIRSAGGHSCCFADVAPMGPAEQTAVEDHTEVLCYTSPSLDRPLLLAGEVTLELWAQTSAPDTDWTAKLCVVGRDGRSVNLREGIVRARLAVDAGDRGVAGETRCYRIRLGHLCAELTTGERLRLQVTSSNFPHWDRNLGTGRPVGQGAMADRVVATQAVWHAADAPSRLTVPVLSGGWWP